MTRAPAPQLGVFFLASAGNSPVACSTSRETVGSLLPGSGWHLARGVGFGRRPSCFPGTLAGVLRFSDKNRPPPRRPPAPNQPVRFQKPRLANRRGFFFSQGVGFGRRTEIIVTDRRVMYVHGVIWRDTAEMNMGKIESVDVNQTPLGRFLNYGDVLVKGTGSTMETFKVVDRPLDFRNMVTAA